MPTEEEIVETIRSSISISGFPSETVIEIYYKDILILKQILE